MVSKLISISVTGILILLVIGAIWQVAPVSAGFTPTPPTVIPPTAIPPTATPIPREKNIPPTATPTATPTAIPPQLLPVAGGPASGLSHIEIIAAGVLVLLLAAISLVIRELARTKTDK